MMDTQRAESIDRDQPFWAWSPAGAGDSGRRRLIHIKARVGSRPTMVPLIHSASGGHVNRVDDRRELGSEPAFALNCAELD